MKPISTAPRDGTHILGWSDEWVHDGWLTMDRGFYECWWEDGMWCSDRYNHGEFGVGEQPTHWCELPEEPVQPAAPLTGKPLGSVAQMLGITGIVMHPFEPVGTISTASGATFEAPAHIAQWLATA